MASDVELKLDDLIKMKTDDLIAYIETCFDPDSDFDPAVIRQMLEGDDEADEFKRLLITSLVSSTNENNNNNQENDDGVSKRRKLKQRRKENNNNHTSTKIKPRNNNNNYTNSEFNHYQKKFKLKKCKVILTHMSQSSVRSKSLFKVEQDFIPTSTTTRATAASIKVKSEQDPWTIKEEVDVHYEQFHYCGICSQNFTTEVNLQTHLKKCHNHSTIVKQEVKQEDQQEEGNDADDIESNSDYGPENETDLESNSSSSKESEEAEDSEYETKIEKRSRRRKKSSKKRSSSSSKPIREPKPGEKIFTCDICSKYFFYNQNLTKHKKTHDVDENGKRIRMYKCTIPNCSKDYIKKSSLHNHMLVSHLEVVEREKILPVISCTVPNCDRKIGTTTGLEQHLRRFHNIVISTKNDQGKHVCSVTGCQKEFDHRSKLHKHRWSAHRTKKCDKKPKPKPKAYSAKCLLCEITFENLEDTEKHEETHSFEKPYKCAHCYKRFSRKDHCKKHEGHVHAKNLLVDKFPCSFEGCDASYSFKDRLQRHERSVHGRPKLTTVSTLTLLMTSTAPATADDTEGGVTQSGDGHPPSKVKYNCPVSNCSKASTTISYLNAHLQSVHPDFMPLICPVAECGKKFALDHYLTIHTRRVHRPLTKIRGEFGYHCTFSDMCDKVYTTRKALLTHLAVHRGEFRYPCTVEGCSKKFAAKHRLRQHMWVHASNKTFKCPYCDEKSSAHKTSVRYHIVTTHKDVDHGLKTFNCQFCKATFFSPSRLGDHVRSMHTNEKPFVCKEDGCDRKFCSAVSLYRHKKVHDGRNKNSSMSNNISKQCSERPKWPTRRKWPEKRKSSFLDNEEDSSDDDKDLEDEDPFKEITPTTTTTTTSQQEYGAKKLYPCTFENCPLTFFQGNALRRHLKSHSEQSRARPEVPTITLRTRRKRKLPANKSTTNVVPEIPVNIKVEPIEEGIIQCKEEQLSMVQEDPLGVINVSHDMTPFNSAENSNVVSYEELQGVALKILKEEV